MTSATPTVRPIIPTTMRALVQRRYGTSDVLADEMRPVPTPRRGEVLVRVEAMSPDAGTIHLLAGRPLMVRPAVGWRTPRQPVPGLALAGQVVAIGEEVTTIAVGDHVAGSGAGALAEYAVAPARKLALAPSAVSMTDAASIPISAVTALQAVRDVARVEAGQRVLVIGAGGGVGAFAAQYAALAGADVTAVVSARKSDFVRSLGVERLIDYARESDPSRWGTFDVVIDTADGRPLHVLRRALTRRGTLVIVGADGVGGPVFEGFDRQLFRVPLANMVASQRIASVMQKETGDDVARVLGQVAEGSIASAVTEVVPFADARAALDRLAAKQVAGKLVLTLGR